MESSIEQMMMMPNGNPFHQSESNTYYIMLEDMEYPQGTTGELGGETQLNMGQDTDPYNQMLDDKSMVQIIAQN